MVVLVVGQPYIRDQRVGFQLVDSKVVGAVRRSVNSSCSVLESDKLQYISEF